MFLATAQLLGYLAGHIVTRSQSGSKETAQQPLGLQQRGLDPLAVLEAKFGGPQSGHRVLDGSHGIAHIRSPWKPRGCHYFGRDHVPDVHESRRVGEPPRRPLASARDRERTKPIALLAFLTVLVDRSLAQRPAGWSVVREVESRRRNGHEPRQRTAGPQQLGARRGLAEAGAVEGRDAFRQASCMSSSRIRRLTDEQRCRYRISGQVRIERERELDRRNEQRARAGPAAREARSAER